MIVLCECSAKLRIDDSKISDKGSRVRCPRCSTVLHVKKQSQQTRERRPAAPVIPPESRHDPSVAPPAAGQAAGPGTAPAVSATVLIAHDSQSIREMIRALLIESGFRVETAADGVEVLKKASDIKPDAMLLDVGLPGIYGFELCERLKGDVQTRAIKIILLTSSYDSARYKREPVDLYGADDYIDKHQISDQLTSKLRKLLYPEQPAAAPEPAPKQNEPALESVIPQTGKYEYVTRNVLLRTDIEIPPAPSFEPGEAPDSQASSQKPEPVLEHQQRADVSPEAHSWSGDPFPSKSDGSALTPESFSIDSSIFQQSESAVPKVEGAGPEAVEKARRLARIIVSDIVLYNQETAREGVKNGTFYEVLKDDIQEGRQLYEKRVPGSIRSTKDYLQEAFDNFLRSRKQT